MTLISKRAFMEKYHVGLESLNKMIMAGEIQMVGKKIMDTYDSSNHMIPRELYELEIQKRVEAETKLQNIQKIIGG